MVQVDWPVYALFKDKHNPYLKASWKKKMANFTKLSFCQYMQVICGTKLLRANVQCVYIVQAKYQEKYQIVSSKVVVRVDWPCMQYLSTSITHI